MLSRNMVDVMEFAAIFSLGQRTCEWEKAMKIDGKVLSDRLAFTDWESEEDEIEEPQSYIGTTTPAGITTLRPTTLRLQHLLTHYSTYGCASKPHTKR